ncbi:MULTISPECIES: dTDP-glucose 4,6-dehydratase [Dehalobacter]|uniref:dTDP-glucose 4,6-dehydratase n=2 Tax=Dehalobacter restrictus TaxID=55583 RepID=A0A857DKM9_9FIRM|nr:MULTISPECIES: dTDP-glucose 4,6-dehydratase [Dehalobacter]AHF10645.1 spore coat protein [Dehalobacter restrictus DSM 9455]MCG1026383.1 dTDP-glucose 4,6-dehydratase [Dehalobacter sp.]MDJ0305494.1 dTDP-glucose 4,6-dehydratase [Dehalobacter sp.]OCZ54634.1 dTDP-glucose 4,6-dehydratase [Dehalobacter sp. TeCB1]QHA01271.1 dTDP-glucose 4,6-dehydratase [Dehalobacter restrictus]
MRVLMVTGGAGFIGSNFIKYILQRNQDVIVINFDKLTYAGKVENLQDLAAHPRYYFTQGDISTAKEVKRILQECDPDDVINFAAESHVDRSITDPLVFGRSNLMGTLTLLHCFKEHWEKNGFTGKRFIQVSTDEVYGSLDNEAEQFSEHSMIRPNSPYSASKAAADLMARSFARTYGFPVIVTRCCNNYGPNQDKEKFIPHSIIQVLQNMPLTVYGDGSHKREWIHVLDHCAALAEILSDGEPGEVYNIGSGEETSNLEMARTILNMLGKPVDALVQVADRAGHDWRYALDSTKLKTKLGWQCRYHLNEGIGDTIQWYRDNRAWWDKSDSKNPLG